MKKRIIIFGLIITSFQFFGQDEKFVYPAFSPKGTISQIVGNTSIGIEYERPSARKRQIFGELVPWNKIWRIGAGRSTKIRFDKDVKVGGQSVPAGNYALFAIPNPKEWIVIISKDTTAYGVHHNNSKNDIARFVVIPKETSRYYETFNIDIELAQHNANMYISWANTQINFEIETSTNELVEDFIRNELLTEKNKLPRNYARAASYLFYRGVNVSDGMSLADKALEMDETFTYVKIWKKDMYKKLKLYDEALEEIDELLIILEKNKEKNKSLIVRLKLDHKQISEELMLNESR